MKQLLATTALLLATAAPAYGQEKTTDLTAELKRKTATLIEKVTTGYDSHRVLEITGAPTQFGYEAFTRRYQLATLSGRQMATVTYERMLRGGKAIDTMLTVFIAPTQSDQGVRVIDLGADGFTQASSTAEGVETILDLSSMQAGIGTTMRAGESAIDNESGLGAIYRRANDAYDTVLGVAEIMKEGRKQEMKASVPLANVLK